MFYSVCGLFVKMDQNKLECQSISYDLDEMELETISFNSDDDGQIENYEDIGRIRIIIS